MRTMRARPLAAANSRGVATTLVGASLTAACFASAAYAQDTAPDGGVITLPTVDVETTQAPAPAPKPAAKPTRTAAHRPAAPTVCTPDYAGTPICAEQEAAERAAAQAAAAQAAAEAQARAGSNPNADPDAPFRATGLTNSVLQGDIADMPRTVTAITKEVLTTTNTTSIRQLARSTPGVSLGFGEGGNAYGDNIYIRGFKANNDIYVDGVRDPGVSVRETFDTEQVEVLKGPSGSVAGRGTTGGALNVATKKPQDVDFSKFSTELTSAGTVRQTFDLNRVLDDRLQLRFNGLLQDGAVAGRDAAHDNRKGLAAALRYRLSDSVTLEGEYSYTKIEQMPDWGVPFITDGDETDGVSIPSGPVTDHGIDRNTFYGVEGRDFQDVTRHAATARAIWDIDGNLKLTNTLRGSTSVNDYVLTAPSSVEDNGSANPQDWTVGLSFKSTYQETDVISNTTELTGSASWLGVEHDFVAGLLLQHEKVRATGYDNLQSEDYEPPAGQRGCTVSAINPDPSACWMGVQPVRSDDFTQTDVRTISAYFVDRIEITPQWLLDAGLRVDHYDITRTGKDRAGDAYSLSRSDTMWNGNLGLTWKPRENVSVYGAYGTSTNPMGQEIAAGGGFYGGLDEGGEDLSPERNTAFELGVKYELRDHLLLTAALFQTTKDNAREDVGPRGATVTQDTLKYRFRGIELGVAGKLNDRIGLYGGAVYMESEILESDDPTAIGESLATVAHQQFNLLTTYDVSNDLMLGIQANWMGERELGTLAPNDNTLPAYWSFDLVGSYDLSDRAEVRFGVKNALDAVNYDTAYRSGEPFTYVAPGREIWAAMDLKF
ncbi:TonB-dependent receptor [Tropicibacter oceani]|uniref:TonB-dependent siderophore receptor n=1 Tax=Tropicibacter oceani TaxID=3058420 RepID=A0ABY8QGQ3_9RHOB|nr:TonB-dependent siderophore receptor [Tropicibacter oceani]WGW03183.1 TonB-dependent siderophore receptor [Tropicibacter oceani]